MAQAAAQSKTKTVYVVELIDDDGSDQPWFSSPDFQKVHTEAAPAIRAAKRLGSNFAVASATANPEGEIWLTGYVFPHHMACEFA